MLAQAMQGDEGTYNEEQLLIMERSGYPEETYYTFSYSPIPDDDGGVGGIICANTDDTRRVIGERQLSLLRELAAATVDARTLEQACERSAQALASDARDLPFALLYLAAPDGRSLTLGCVCGIARGHPAAPETLALDASSPWPVDAALRDQRARLVRGLRRAVRRRFSDRRLGPAAIAKRRRSAFRRAATPAAPACWSPGSIPSACSMRDYRRFLDLVASEIAPASPMPRLMRQNAGAPRRSPKSIAPRPYSSRMSATNSGRRWR